jgi:pyruvate/2-oxoglutarate dehydrogenase complex dihydrolipoamide acyltransferase (E2) component
MGRATLASLTLHVLVALAIPALAWTASTAPPVETVSFSHILHVEIVPPPRARHAPPRAVAPHHNPKPDLTFADHIRLVAEVAHRNASPAPHVATNAPAAPAVGAVARAGSGKADSDPAPDATPSPAVRAVASVGNRQNGGYLPFGAQQPDPVLDPDVRKQLDELGTHVTLVVTVGEDGRTESIVFLPPLDAQLEGRIRSLLADANWDPAVCGGGVSCEARATIKL